jgi:hypothetical protein
MKPPVEGWVQTETTMTVPVPSQDGMKTEIAVIVPAWKDAEGEVYLDDRATEIIEEVRKRR